jgi:hypothetical protein
MPAERGRKPIDEKPPVPSAAAVAKSPVISGLEGARDIMGAARASEEDESRTRAPEREETRAFSAVSPVEDESRSPPLAPAVVLAAGLMVVASALGIAWRWERPMRPARVAPSAHIVPEPEIAEPRVSAAGGETGSSAAKASAQERPKHVVIAHRLGCDARCLNRRELRRVERSQ